MQYKQFSLLYRVVEVRGGDVAEKAIDTMHRHEVKGRMIVVREEREKDRIRHQKQGGSSSGSAMGDMGSLGGGMGMSMGMGNNMMGNMGGGGGGNNMNTNMGGGGGGGGGSSFNAQVLNQLGIDSSNLTSQVFIANVSVHSNQGILNFTLPESDLVNAIVIMFYVDNI